MSERVRFEDWMSEADAAMWYLEQDPRLRSTILSVWVLDAPPDAERFEATLATSLADIPRLRQRVVEDPLGIAPPRWELDPHFDPTYHLRHLTLGGEGTLRDLLDLAEPIAMQAFDKDRPLWEFHLVGGLADGRSGVVMKLHHAMSDGVGLVRMTESLVERSREPDTRRARSPESLERAPERSPVDRLREALAYRRRLNRDRRRRVVTALGRGALALAARPTETLGRAGETLGSIGRLLRPVSEPLSPVMRDRSMGLRLHGFTFPLEALKRAGKAVGGTVNDAFVGAITAGLGEYHAARGRPVDELRMTMPINLREGDEAKRAGNQFAPSRFVVPIGIPDPAERMLAIQARVREQRAERALPLMEEVTGLLNRLPRVATLALAGGMLKAIDFVTSNVPGPRFPVYASGAKIEHMFPFGPPAGAAVNITLFSYDGQCQVGVNCDRAAVPDSDHLVECLVKGFDEIGSIA